MTKYKPIYHSRTQIDGKVSVKINQFIMSRISELMERSRFYQDLSIDLHSKCDKSV